MKRRELPASTDASHSYSGGASGFSPSLWNPWSLWAVVLHVWLRNALLVWQIFIYLLVFKWEGYDWLWRASGTRVEGITRTERACGLKILPRVSFFFFFLVSLSFSAVVWWCARFTAFTVNLLLTHHWADQTSKRYCFTSERQVGRVNFINQAMFKKILYFNYMLKHTKTE